MDLSSKLQTLEATIHTCVEPVYNLLWACVYHDQLLQTSDYTILVIGTNFSCGLRPQLASDLVSFKIFYHEKFYTLAKVERTVYKSLHTHHLTTIIISSQIILFYFYTLLFPIDLFLSKFHIWEHFIHNIWIY